jgi:hypothetical protein
MRLRAGLIGRLFRASAFIQGKTALIIGGSTAPIASPLQLRQGSFRACLPGCFNAQAATFWILYTKTSTSHYKADGVENSIDSIKDRHFSL